MRAVGLQNVAVFELRKVADRPLVISVAPSNGASLRILRSAVPSNEFGTCPPASARRPSSCCVPGRTYHDRGRPTAEGNGMKSSVDEIRRRFDADVERFSNLQTGQSATVDAPLAMSLVAEAAAAVTPHARHVLDVGCGAGNYTLKLL